MLWITPALRSIAAVVGCPPAALASADTGSSWRRAGHARSGGGRVLAEQFLDPVPTLFQAAQRQAEVCDAVANNVVGLLAGQFDEQPALIRHRGQATPAEFFQQQLGTLV